MISVLGCKASGLRHKNLASITSVLLQCWRRSKSGHRQTRGQIFQPVLESMGRIRLLQHLETIIKPIKDGLTCSKTLAPCAQQLAMVVRGGQGQQSL